MGARVAPRHGFGAVRCATDDVDGDNVQQLLFPAGIHHVFCYAYYVSRSPVGGTIIIRSQVDGAPTGTEPSFPFSGDISYAANGFTLKDGRSVTFHRAGGLSWHITESAVADYKLVSVKCRSSTAASTASTGATALSVALAAGDTVVCTFVNEWVPPVGSLTIRQVTEGGTGSFAYIAAPFHDDPTRVVATSRREGVAVNAHPERNLVQLVTSGYVIQVLPPAHAVGHWQLVRADCDGRRLAIRHFAFSQVTFRIEFRSNSVCTFTSKLTPPGSIRVSAVTEGATGPARIVIDSLGEAPRSVRPTRGHLASRRCGSCGARHSQRRDRPPPSRCLPDHRAAATGRARRDDVEAGRGDLRRRRSPSFAGQHRRDADPGDPGPLLLVRQHASEQNVTWTSVVDEYVELELAHAAADLAIPAIRAHLGGGSACRDEHDSLLALLRVAAARSQHEA